MNISINNTCNNSCSYCFQSRYNNQQEAKFITLEHYEKILNFLNNSMEDIHILGGEPTLHPDIVNIIEITIKKNYKPLLITNLLIGNVKLLTQLSNFKELEWLVNGTHSKQTFPLFDRNLEFLLENLNSNKVTISFCLTNNNIENEQVLNYIEYFSKKYSKQTLQFRISPAAPNGHEKYTLINYDEWYSKILTIVEKYQNLITFDCPLTFCMLSKKTAMILFSSPALQIDSYDRVYSKCRGAMDILLDDKLYLCHSYSDIGIPIFDYPDFDTCYGSLMYQISQDIQGKNYEYCDKNCKYFIECNGFCPAILHAFDKEKSND